MNKKQGELLGGIERTGVFISKSDFDLLLEVMAKAKAKDKLAKQSGISQTGASLGGLIPATTGTMGLQAFMRLLVKAYGFKDSDSVLYGVSPKREICRWISREDIAKKLN